MKKQRQENNFWKEFEELLLESSSDKSNVERSSLVKAISNEENSEVDNKHNNNTFEELGNEDEGVHLKIEESSFKPVWKNNAGSYLLSILKYRL